MPSSLAKIYIWRPSNITIYPTTPQGAKGPAPCSTSSVWMPATHRAPNRGGSGSEFPLAPRLASSGRTPGGRGNARANQRSMPQPDVGKHGKLEDFGGQIMADRWILYILDRVGDMSSDLLQSMEGSSASLLVYQCSPAIATSFTGGNTVFLEACGIKVVHGTDFPWSCFSGQANQNIASWIYPSGNLT